MQLLDVIKHHHHRLLHGDGGQINHGQNKCKSIKAKEEDDTARAQSKKPGAAPCILSPLLFCIYALLPPMHACHVSTAGEVTAPASKCTHGYSLLIALP